MSQSASQQGKPLDILKTEAEIAKLQVEAGKLLAETQKLNRESRFMPLVYGAALVGAATAIAKLFIH
ncbi:hypothetical protein EGY16_32710 [Burkholderia pseudomallei]|uniref:hypothetical protein n=1 Tax=Burkholderia pseudomallei TaxID=28450 RepID=UPI000753BF1D|nr:hypothetical protein [Burkholderia pseudomallei]KVD68732.1 hypothetical protein WI88_32760 [Burkholderia ubonensis]AYX32591.1 hypothetical protein EGY16_32710 [Burkholderia pseudomallei]KVO83329.1 hypothetical protein WJ81_23085 [Burkholderia ubonensis]KVU68950.1 hypothetical protein WK72_14600 [Burkholderia ubonensis]KVW40332.1 hypothetical protein WK94_23535 [Burkholderia ubonensis]